MASAPIIDRVLGAVRRGAVAADAGDDDVDLVGAGVAAAGLDRGGAGRVQRRDVRGDEDVGRRRLVVQAALDHRPGPFDQLLGGLGDQDERAGPVAFQLCHDLGDADQEHDVGIVAAGVHDRDEAAAGGCAGGPAGIGQARFFENGKRVHVAAEHDDRAGAVLEDADDARFADAGVRFVAELLEFLGDEGGRLHFLKAELGVGVEVLEDFDEAMFVLIDERADFLGELGVRFFIGQRLRGEGSGAAEDQQQINAQYCRPHEGLARRGLIVKIRNSFAAPMVILVPEGRTRSGKS